MISVSDSFPPLTEAPHTRQLGAVVQAVERCPGVSVQYRRLYKVVCAGGEIEGRIAGRPIRPMMQPASLRLAIGYPWTAWTMGPAVPSSTTSSRAKARSSAGQTSAGHLYGPQ